MDKQNNAVCDNVTVCILLLLLLLVTKSYNLPIKQELH